MEREPKECRSHPLVMYTDNVISFKPRGRHVKITERIKEFCEYRHRGDLFLLFSLYNIMMCERRRPVSVCVCLKTRLSQDVPRWEGLRETRLGCQVVRGLIDV